MVQTDSGTGAHAPGPVHTDGAAVAVQWAVNVVDIEGVIAKVGARVLGDPAVSEGVRASRAQGLRELGLIFRQMKARCRPAAHAGVLQASSRKHLTFHPEDWVSIAAACSRGNLRQTTDPGRVVRGVVCGGGWPPHCSHRASQGRLRITCCG